MEDMIGFKTGDKDNCKKNYISDIQANLCTRDAQIVWPL